MTQMNVVDVNSDEWIRDSARWMGRHLVGKFAHYCPDWDFLTIDETCDEFSCCSCDPPRGMKQEYDAAQDKILDKIDMENNDG